MDGNRSHYVVVNQYKALYNDTVTKATNTLEIPIPDWDLFERIVMNTIGIALTGGLTQAKLTQGVARLDWTLLLVQ